MLGNLSAPQACPLCDETPVAVEQEHLLCHVGCKVCGQFDIDLLLAHHLPNDPDLREQRYMLSGYTRERSEFGQPIALNEEAIKSILSSGELPKTPIEKAERLLSYCGRKASSPGHPVNTQEPYDRSIAYAKDWMEFAFYREYLGVQGLLEHKAIVTIKGWERLRQLSQQRADTRICFVAMKFDQSLDEVYENGIRRAVIDGRYDPLRIDKHEHINKIDDEIIAGIRRSKFMVADFTGHRGGVYFEAGFALGLGIPVIWTCRKDDLGSTHFDTRQFNHIDWTAPEDLYERLIQRISAVIT